MAIKASCPYCKKSFSAPEAYRGKKLGCPACGKRFVLKTEDDVDADQREALATEKRREEDREKIALIERMDSRGQRRAGRPYYEEFQTGQEGVRHFGPRSHSRFSRFRALSDFLVLGAYVEILLVSVGMGLVIFLKLSGAIVSLALVLLLIVGWLVVGTGLFLFLKYLGELAYLLADAADQLGDVVGLLEDVRENTEAKDT